jgi:two-component system NtrC family sensor kinase
MNDINKRRILVIDDNQAIHKDFRKILETPPLSAKALASFEASLFGDAPGSAMLDGFEIDSAFQGEEGLDYVRRAKTNQRPYAMAFIDVRMPPGWDGIETTAQIWKVDPDIQVVICTAFSDYSWGAMIDKLGQTDRLVILKKPFDNVEVSQLAQALTHKWELFQLSQQKVIDLEELVQKRTADLVKEIAERKGAEHERQIMEVQLRQSQKLEAIGQLASGIAHEINTPTQYIGDNTRFLKDSFETIARLLHSHEALLKAARTNSLTPDVVVQAEQILAASDLNYLFAEIPPAINQTLEGIDRVSKIVKAMKEFSHPGGKDKTPSNLNKAVECTVMVANNEWKYVADLNLELDPDLPLVPCYLGEFNQCILNLVINASHAIADVIKQKPGTKGLITVRTRRDDNHVEVWVTDTGTGIPEAVRPKIFEPFFTTKEVGKGTGQGLSIIYTNIVKKHGGTVRFETETGKGTSFILRLPMAAGAAVAST